MTTRTTKRVEFEVHNDTFAVTVTAGEATADGGRVLWVDFVLEQLSPIEEPEQMCHGFVKWDGCCQIYAPPDSLGPMFHFDGYESFTETFGLCMKRVWAEATAIGMGWDGCAGGPE